MDERYTPFTSKEEIDRWYQETIAGLGRALALRCKGKDEVLQGHHRVAIDATNFVLKQAYQDLGINENPEIVDIRSLVGRTHKI